MSETQGPEHEKNIFDGLTKQEVILTMDLLLALSGFDEQKERERMAENVRKMEAAYQAQKDLEDTLRRAMGDE